MNLRDTDVRVHELAQERAREGAQGVLGRAVDGAAGVRLAPSDGAEINDVSRVARLEVCSSPHKLRKAWEKRKRKSGPLTNSCVTAIRPKTFTWNMDS